VKNPPGAGPPCPATTPAALPEFLPLPSSVRRHSGSVRVLSDILRSSISCSLLVVVLHLHLLRSLDSREEWFFLLRFPSLEQIHTSTTHSIEGKLKYTSRMIMLLGLHKFDSFFRQKVVLNE
jgi:hypothetical protein